MVPAAVAFGAGVCIISAVFAPDPTPASQLPAPYSHWFLVFSVNILSIIVLYLVVCITLCSFSFRLCTYDTYEEYVLYVCTMYNNSNIFSLLQGIVICFYGLLHSPIPGTSLCAATKEVNRVWIPLLFFHLVAFGIH